MSNTADGEVAALHRSGQNAPPLGLASAVFSASFNLDQVLAVARPRLMRLAYARGVPPDEVDDAVQEALLVAWRRLDQLRSRERFDAWLDAICRHVCQHYVRKSRSITARQVTVADPFLLRDGPDGSHGSPRITDMLDPAEELQRQDLETLLDLALNHLPADARQVIELCYLENLSQREAAARLRLTISALEARLHRTRMQLRQVLSGALRADAEAFGVALDEDISAGWRETREWCNLCAQHRLRGTFEPLPDGRVNFRLRCPECSRHTGIDIYSTGGTVPLAGAHSFHPAFKRLIRSLKDRYSQGYTQALVRGWQTCPSCAGHAPLRVEPPGGTWPHFARQFRLVLACPTCQTIIMPAAFAASWADPSVQPLALRFIEEHPRWLMEPDVATRYGEQPAIRFQLSDVSSAARLTILAHAETLAILTLYQR